MNESIKQTIKDLREKIFDKNSIEFLIVGSLALSELGMENGEPHDIDIEAKCTPEQEEIFRMLSDSQKNSFYKENTVEAYPRGAEYRMDKVTWKHKPYVFKWGDVLVNVWAVSEFSHDYLTLNNGLKIAKVMSVIKKKAAYQRNKDRAFLVNLAFRFLEICGANSDKLSSVFVNKRNTPLI